jgi:hypothetical protein
LREVREEWAEVSVGKWGLRRGVIARSDWVEPFIPVYLVLTFACGVAGSCWVWR